MRAFRSPAAAALCLPVFLVAVSGCDMMSANLRAQETAEWRKTYQLQAGGRVEIRNVNGKIDVEPSTGNTVEIVAVKRARGASPEAARQALGRIEIIENASPSDVRVETRVPRGSGFFQMGGTEVHYTV
jgi:hypothetical protein